jgi:hypothetical protein
VLDTNYLMYADEVMAIILHLAQNLEEELFLSVDPTANPPATAPPISAFVDA